MVFLDRDGVLTRVPSGHILNTESIVLEECAETAIGLLGRSSFLTGLVTNQSCVGRGVITATAAVRIQREIVRRLDPDSACIDSWAICPHDPQSHCDCRKPMPGLIDAITRHLPVNLRDSWMIGDALTDSHAGSERGMRTILVLTGRGLKQLRRASADELSRVSYVCGNVLDAVNTILDLDK